MIQAYVPQKNKSAGILLLFLVMTTYQLMGQKGVASNDSLNQNPYNDIEQGPILKLKRQVSTGSVATIAGTELFKTNAGNLTNTLYGRLSGLYVGQGQGEPGFDAANLRIRGTGTYDNQAVPIFVDGFQTTLNYFQYLSPAEIESVSLLKDAVALAALGMKGANGALWVTTRKGGFSKPTVNFRLATGLQSATQINKPLPSYQYAQLYNQAVSNDKGGVWTPFYSATQIQAYQNGTGTNVDWYDQVLRSNAPITNASLNFSGGDSNARYMVVLNYRNNQGIYDVKNTDATKNVQMQHYNVLTNLHFNFFRIFEAGVSIGARAEDRYSPAYTGATLWNDLASYPNNIYPVKSPNGFYSGTTVYPNNPVASVNALGWFSTRDNTLLANFSLKEKLDFITPGLYLSQGASLNQWSRSFYSKTKTYARFINDVQQTNDINGNLTVSPNTPVNQYDWKQYTVAAGYDKQLGRHTFNAGINYLYYNYNVDANQNSNGLNTGTNTAYHFQNVGGRIHYAYNGRYLAEVGLGASGSDNFAPGNRWGLYPAASVGWLLSEESFLQPVPAISLLKLRVSAGKTGNGQTGAGRYLYQQYYNYSGYYITGNNSLNYNYANAQTYSENENVFAEQSLKYNIGLDVVLWKKWSVTLEGFLDKRQGIVTQDNTFSAVYGLAAPYSNIGRVTNRGFEVVFDFTDQIGPVSYSLGGNATYSKNRIDYNAEVTPVYSYNGRTGSSIGVPMGLVSEGFYQLTDFDASGNLLSGQAVPAFGRVQPGDLKYRDLNGDGSVNQLDFTAIGNSYLPSLNYAFYAKAGFLGFDANILFQGQGGRSLNLLDAPRRTVAFQNNGNVYSIAEGAWAYYPAQGIDTRATATYPRLSALQNTNNYQNATFWMKNGNFLRIRTAELGYTLPASVLQRAKIQGARLFVNAVNPLTWSSFQRNYHMDPETLSGYPALKSWNLGFSVTF